MSSNLQIGKDLEASYHEMVVCGGLSAQFSLNFVNLLLNASLGVSLGPTGYTFDGNGKYLTGSTGIGAGGSMELSLYLAEDTTYGKRGDLIQFDAFQMSNYFKGAQIRASGSIDLTGAVESSLTVEFVEPGPGTELMGLGPAPSSPLELDFLAIVERLGQVEMKGDITVDDLHGDTHVIYTLRTEGSTVGDMLASNSSSLELVDIQASNEVTGQTVTVTNWGMDYQAGSGGTLDGTIDVQITGGQFDYTASYFYPHRKTPDVSLGCMPKPE